MENYTKGKITEEKMTRDSIPISDLPSDFVWMKVKPGSKMRNLIGYALKEMKTHKYMVWSGQGPATPKVISCVEIMKKKLKDLHQITKIMYGVVEEMWNPKLPELDSLRVTRNIPVIHILLSSEPLNDSEPGYQAPGKNALFEDLSSRRRGKDTLQRNRDSDLVRKKSDKKRKRSTKVQASNIDRDPKETNGSSSNVCKHKQSVSEQPVT